MFLLRPGGERVQIGDDEETLVFILEGNPVTQAADIVSQV
jgi:hypothetical protein